MADSDVLERNDDLNRRMQSLSMSYTRRKVVDTLLVIIIVLVITAITVLLFSDHQLETRINTTDIQETQLICEHLLNESQEHHYVICDEVGRPEIKGE